MKKTAFTILLAGALLGAGCSPDEQTAANSTPVQLTAEQLAAIQKEDKAAIKAKREANGLPAEEASPSATPTP